MLRLGCVGDLLRFEKREIEVAAFAPDRSSPVKSRVVCKSERKLLDASVRLSWRPPSVREA